MLGKLAVNVPVDGVCALVRVNDEPVGFYDGERWRLRLRLRLSRILGNGRFGLGTRATRPKTEAKDAGDREDNE
jgi:hypothetical protein